MKSIILFTVMIITLISCNNHRPTTPILNTDNLPGSFISLNADSSYTLKTFKGTIIKIAKNSFDVPAGTTVKIELKEAYTQQDILLGGLTTKSNGRLLQSGGMVYFNVTANGHDTKIIKPINIGVPTNNYDDSMQLFKGEVNTDSTINWIAPSPLDSTAFSKELISGKAIFKANCANCHKPTEDFTGPALAGCRKREPNPDWAYNFVDHVNTMIVTSTYARNLHGVFGSLMTQQNLTPREIKSILDYCDNTALSDPNFRYSTSASASPDSFIVSNDIDSTVPKAMAPCGYDTIYYASIDTTSQTTPPADSSIAIIDTTLYNSQQDSVSLYQFNISQCGWYNIDCFINANISDVTNVFLSATFNNIIDVDSMQVYLCIPARKLLADGQMDQAKNYGFYYGSDTVSLILHDPAMIIVVGRISDKMYYGISKFNIADSQSISVNIKESSKEEINSSIHQNGLDKIKDGEIIPTTATITKIDTDYPKAIPCINGKTIMKIVPIACGGNGSGSVTIPVFIK